MATPKSEAPKAPVVDAASSTPAAPEAPATPDPAAADAGTSSPAPAVAPADPTPPVEPAKPTRAAKVKPKQYADNEWPIGGPAPHQVVREYDDAGVLGAPRDGAIEPGQRGIIVAFEGDVIGRGIRHELGLSGS